MSRHSLFVVIGFGVALAAAGSLAQQDTGGGDWQHHHSVTLGQETPQGPTGPRTGEKVTFCGRVVSLVEMGCVGIVGQSQTVELTAVSPKPAAGKIISGIGTISTQPNVCMQGLHLSAATWKEVTSC